MALYQPPPPRGRRWTPGRKAEVCARVIRGEDTFDQARDRHGLTEDELRTWIERFRRHGVAGLSVTKLQEVGR